jgi:hypothetical protein
MNNKVFFCHAHLKMDCEAVEWEDVDWIYLAQRKDQCDAIRKMIMILYVPYKAVFFSVLSYY